MNTKHTRVVVALLLAGCTPLGMGRVSVENCTAFYIILYIDSEQITFIEPLATWEGEVSVGEHYLAARAFDDAGRELLWLDVWEQTYWIKRRYALYVDPSTATRKEVSYE